jgi:hypothetical protein
MKNIPRNISVVKLKYNPKKVKMIPDIRTIILSNKKIFNGL